MLLFSSRQIPKVPFPLLSNVPILSHLSPGSGILKRHQRELCAMIFHPGWEYDPLDTALLTRNKLTPWLPNRFHSPVVWTGHSWRGSTEVNPHGTILMTGHSLPYVTCDWMPTVYLTVDGGNCFKKSGSLKLQTHPTHSTHHLTMHTNNLGKWRMSKSLRYVPFVSPISSFLNLFCWQPKFPRVAGNDTLWLV